jgi:hypothetical protein
MFHLRYDLHGFVGLAFGFARFRPHILNPFIPGSFLPQKLSAFHSFKISDSIVIPLAISFSWAFVSFVLRLHYPIPEAGFSATIVSFPPIQSKSSIL